MNPPLQIAGVVLASLMAAPAVLPTETTRKPENGYHELIAGRIAGSWVLNEELTERLGGSTEFAGFSFQPDEVIKPLGEKMKRALEGVIIYQTGYVKVDHPKVTASGPTGIGYWYLLTEGGRTGHLRLLIFGVVEKILEGKPDLPNAPNTNFAVVLVPSSDRAEDLLFLSVSDYVGATGPTDLFAAYDRAKDAAPPLPVEPPNETKPAAKADEPSWGEASDGLRAGLSCKTKAVRLGEPVVVELVLQNVGKEPLTYYDFKDDDLPDDSLVTNWTVNRKAVGGYTTLDVHEAGYKAMSIRMSINFQIPGAAGIGVPRPPVKRQAFRFLAPGGSIVYSKVDLQPAWFRDERSKPAKGALESAGAYEIQAEYRSHLKGDPFNLTAWTGSVRTDPLPIEVLAAGRTPGAALPAPAPAVSTERDRILAEADRKIRAGMLELSKKFPQLSMTAGGPLEKVLPYSQIPGGIYLMFGRDPRSKYGGRDPVPEKECYSVVIAVVPRAPKGEFQLPMEDLYLNLALMGAVDTSAGDPDLADALSKLVTSALAPLAELDKKAAGMGRGSELP